MAGERVRCAARRRGLLSDRRQRALVPCRLPPPDEAVHGAERTTSSSATGAAPVTDPWHEVVIDGLVTRWHEVTVDGLLYRFRDKGTGKRFKAEVEGMRGRLPRPAPAAADSQGEDDGIPAVSHWLLLPPKPVIVGGVAVCPPCADRLRAAAEPPARDAVPPPTAPEQAPIRYWFAVWTTTAKDAKAAEDGPLVSNVALAGTHPVAWLSSQPESFRKSFVAHLLFFAEIDAATFEAAKAGNYVRCEDGALILGGFEVAPAVAELTAEQRASIIEKAFEEEVEQWNL